MNSWNFFWLSFKLRISEMMAYKFNFFLRIFTMLSFELVLPLITILIYTKTGGFPGWSFHQILLFQGIFMMVDSIDRFFFQRVDWSLSYDVRSGEFDRYLLYPVNTLMYISFINLAPEQLADFLVGAGLVIYSILNMTVSFTFWNILAFIGFAILADIFLFSLAVLKYAIIVRAVRMGRLGEFFNTIKSYGQYPVDIYNAILSSILRYVFPLAVLAYYPSSALLGRPVSDYLIVAVVTLAFFVVTWGFWKSTLRHYTSAGG